MITTLRALGLALFLFIVTPFMATPADAIDVDADNVRAFVDRMVAEHGFDREALRATLEAAERKDKILEAMDRPAEKRLNWGEYRKIFLTRERIAAGAEFWREHADALDAVAADSGVPVEMIVGIIGVETYFGRITGSYRVIDALTTLAFHYPRRADFFTRELESFLLLSREEGIDPTMPTGSYAGAMGKPQFMPSSFLAYAVDATGDGKRDIWNNWSDVAGSVANYFLAHKWRPGEDVVARASLSDRFDDEIPRPSLTPSATVGSLSKAGVEFATDLPPDDVAALMELEGSAGREHWVGFHNFFVITRYNRSVMYALAVFQLGREIEREVMTSAD